MLSDSRITNLRFHDCQNRILWNVHNLRFTQLSHKNLKFKSIYRSTISVSYKISRCKLWRWVRKDIMYLSYLMFKVNISKLLNAWLDWYSISGTKFFSYTSCISAFISESSFISAHECAYVHKLRLCIIPIPDNKLVWDKYI